MKTIIPALTIIILSCTAPDIIIPECSNITHQVSDGHVSIVIQSDAQVIYMTHWGKTWAVLPQYYGCIGFAYHGPEEVVFNIDGKECVVFIE